MIAEREESAGEKRHYRSIWISDVHLGTRHAQVGALLEFLKQVECRYLYLVGDVIDGWQLQSKWHWRDDHNVLIQNCSARAARKPGSFISRATMTNFSTSS